MIVVNIRVSVRKLGGEKHDGIPRRASVVVGEVQLDEDDLKAMKVRLPVAAHLRCSSTFEMLEKQTADFAAARVR